MTGHSDRSPAGALLLGKLKGLRQRLLVLSLSASLAITAVSTSLLILVCAWLDVLIELSPFLRIVILICVGLLAAYLFAQAILAGRPIKVFNHGNMRRDFTYIDDIVDGVLRVLARPPSDKGEAPHRLYNIGNNQPEALLDFIAVLEAALERTAEKELLPLQPGDVPESAADISAIQRDTGFAPTTPISVGVPKFIAWYRDYHRV